MDDCCKQSALGSREKDSSIVMKRLQELQKIVDDTHSYTYQKLGSYSRPEPLCDEAKGPEGSTMSPYFGELAGCISIIRARVDEIYRIIKDSEL